MDSKINLVHGFTFHWKLKIESKNKTLELTITHSRSKFFKVYHKGQ